ncbi:diacylglycerol kinase [Candidatus Uhrbacteria bacterium]|nr:diacylglycerol kinase [Candidatus Uhrbacteria bacterium]
MLNLRLLFKSIHHAFHGLERIFREEQNFRIQLMSAVCAIAMARILHFSYSEYTILTLTITAVLATEVLNTVLERVLDGMKPRLSEYVGDLKDMLAAGVLIVSYASLCVAAFLYIPKIIDLFNLK